MRQPRRVNLGAGDVRNIIIAQLILVPVLAAAFLLRDGDFALAVLYGGGVALGNTLLSARRVARAQSRLSKDPQADVRSIYIGAVERFVFVLGAMAVGMGWLNLDPPGLLLGFALAYLGYPLSRFFPVGARQHRPQS